MAELKPCPFCGFDMPLIYGYELWEGCPDCYIGRKIVCGNCSAEIRRRNEKLVIEAWNRRADNG